MAIVVYAKYSFSASLFLTQHDEKIVRAENVLLLFFFLSFRFFNIGSSLFFIRIYLLATCACDILRRAIITVKSRIHTHTPPSNDRRRMYFH